MGNKSTPPSSSYRYVLEGLTAYHSFAKCWIMSYNMYDGYVLYSLNGVHTYVFVHEPNNN